MIIQGKQDLREIDSLMSHDLSGAYLNYNLALTQTSRGDRWHQILKRASSVANLLVISAIISISGSINS